MFDTKKLFIAGSLGVAALGLIGAGSGATFTDSVNTTQSISTGHILMQIAPDVSTAGTVSAAGHTVTLNPFGPAGSTYDTGANGLTITNASNISVNAYQISLTDGSSGDAALVAGTNVEVLSCAPTCSAQGNTPTTVYTGSVQALMSSPLAVSGPLAPGKTDQFSIRFFTPGTTTLAPGAQDEVFKPTLTVSYVG